jgi:hypothetical protein
MILGLCIPSINYSQILMGMFPNNLRLLSSFFVIAKHARWMEKNIIVQDFLNACDLDY